MPNGSRAAKQRPRTHGAPARGHLPVRTPAHTAREVLCVEPLTAFREEHQCMDLGSRLPPKRPLFCTFFWSPSDVPGGPPNPLSTGLASGGNAPIRDFLYRQEVVFMYVLRSMNIAPVSERHVVKQKVFVDTSDCMRKQLIARSRPAQHRPPPAHRKFLASIFSFISQPNYRHRSAIVARSQLHLLLLKQNEVNRYLQPSSRRKRRVQSILGRCSSSSSINDWTRIVIVRISSRPKDDCACRNFSKQLHFARSGRRIVNIRHG